jgi:hypothetical protein
VNPQWVIIVESTLGCVSKITKAHFRRLNLHIFVEKPRRSTTAPVFFVSICKLIQKNFIFQTLETTPSIYPSKTALEILNPERDSSGE